MANPDPTPAPTPKSPYRGRLAPSPTGYLHVGHARTFWTAYQRARDAGGTLVLRMEDLDPDRSKQVYADAAIEDLRWLGIRWQEGPDRGGPFAPYAQSKRHAVYLAAWRNLLQRGHIYPCRCSRKDLENALGAPHETVRPEPSASALAPVTAARGQTSLRSTGLRPGGTRPGGPRSGGPRSGGPRSGGPHPVGPVQNHPGELDLQDLDDEPIYPGTCRRLEVARQLSGRNSAMAQAPGGSNWRFRVNDGEAVEFEDLNLGPVRFVAGVDFGDFIVWRRDGLPSYQLACVADDRAMGITEVVRGADLLKSTARQILLNRALRYQNPTWYHTKLVVDHNGRRLAKRHDSLSLRTLRRRSLTPMNILSAELPQEA